MPSPDPGAAPHRRGIGREENPMARFPFEEDTRFRFGAFHELVGRYIFIGREPPAERRPPARPATGRRSISRTERSRPPALHRSPDRDAFVIHGGPGAAP
jgi:hypothetical protein